MNEFDTAKLKGVSFQDSNAVFPKCISKSDNKDIELEISITKSQFNPNSLYVTFTTKDSSGIKSIHIYNYFEFQKLVKNINKINKILKQRFLYQDDKRKDLFRYMIAINSAEKLVGIK